MYVLRARNMALGSKFRKNDNNKGGDDNFDDNINGAWYSLIDLFLKIGINAGRSTVETSRLKRDQEYIQTQ